ncbi:hypothetical protein IEE92_03865 [Kocuria sp. cx-116]|uniref:hypothetical protein n=1 Tax=Kocuria sp. cx-116 TaxID=2771378 RepID=UPI0016876F6C|nr:hypothetical protein [Kocuria sp. cx-116]MBD2761700.1 hypothetical protein [Kocuria sp. cx-116]
MTREVEREVTGRAENLQGTLFGTEPGARPVLEHPNLPENTRAAIASATESMRVSGGTAPGALEVSTAAIAVAAGVLSRVNERVGDVLLGTTVADVEVAAWSMTGHPLLGAAAASAAHSKAALVAAQARVTLTHLQVASARQHYEMVEASVGSLFGPNILIMPGWNLTGSATRGMRTVLDEFTTAVQRADITTPAQFATKVRVTSFGVVVAGGGPEGTNAVIRGVGLDDVLDSGLRTPLPSAVMSRTQAWRELGGQPGDEFTVGQYARVWADGLLTGIGETEAQLGAEEAGLQSELGASWPVVRAAVNGLSGKPGFEWLTPYTTGRNLSPAERLLYPYVRAHAVRPKARETMTGIAPSNASEHGIAPLARRPLPTGVEFDGAAPTTVGGTAAALKDAKNVVQGRENSTVLVQKTTDRAGRAAFSVVLTGTEVWHDGRGVHDIAGIVAAMKARPHDSLGDLPPAQRAVTEALKDAGIQPGDSVVLSGHSLGGIDAAGLAMNHEFQRLYSVAALTTFGAPVGGFEFSRETSVMAVEHNDDMVPPLDGIKNPDHENRSTVRVDTQYNDQYSPAGSLSGVGAHDMYVYTLGAQGISNSGEPAVMKHERALGAAIASGAGTRTETYMYEVLEDHVVHNPEDP